MPVIQPGLTAYQTASTPWSAERCVNWYVERALSAAKTPIALIGREGVTATGTATGNARASHRALGKAYAVMGSTLYRVNADGTTTSLGSVGPNGNVTMADNGAQVAICTPPQGYIYTISTGALTQISDTDFPGVTSVTHLNQRFIWSTENSGEFVWSTAGDGTGYGALDFFTAEMDGDNLVGVFADHDVLLAMGTRTIEPWQNIAGSDVYARTLGAAIERGCRDIMSVRKFDNSVAFLGDDYNVYRLEGYSPRVISTPPISKMLEEAEGPYIGSTFDWRGHKFYGLTASNCSFWYDASTQLWHERASYGFDRYRFAHMLHCYDTWHTFDLEGAGVFFPDQDAKSDAGDEIVRTTVTPPLSAENKRFTVPEIRLDFETGVGLVSGQGAQPKAMVRFSRDGGRTFGNERQISLGGIGEYKTRAVARRNGIFHQSMVMQISVSDPVIGNLLGLYADIAA